jgi:hypothetical protein
MRREGRGVMRREGREVMRREGQWVRRPSRWGASERWPRGCVGSRDHVRWEHQDTRFGEAAAPRGVDSAQRVW